MFLDHVSAKERLNSSIKERYQSNRLIEPLSLLLSSFHIQALKLYYHIDHSITFNDFTR